MMNINAMIELGDGLLIMGISAAVIAFFQYMVRWMKNPY
jgi:hypothetical protein